MRKLLTFLFVLFASSTYAEEPDSLGVKPHSLGGTELNGEISPVELGTVSPEEYSPERQKRLADSLYFALRYKYNDNIVPGVGPIAVWDNGSFYATGDREEYRGLMGIERGRLVLSQQFGNLDVSLHGGVDKIAYFGGMARSWNYGGSMTYNFSEELALTMYGDYYATHVYGRGLSPAVLGFIGTTTYGGYLNYRPNGGRFGVKVGAQSYRSAMTGGWQTQPIVMPYVKLNNGAEIGADVGGIIYNLIRSASSDSRWGVSGNPTIAPGRPGPPAVRPLP